MKIADRRVVITGASSGIGRELARQFAAKGCAVALAARNAAQLEANAKEIRDKGGRAIAVRTDVSRRADVEALVAVAVREFGGVDILVNNAGIAPASGSLLDNTEPDFRATMEVNFMGSVYGVWAAAPHMEKQGEGLIVFVSSIVGKRGIPFASAYCASKFAVQGLAESIRPELAKKKIHVLTVCPPGVDTAFFENNGRPRGHRFRLHPAATIARMIIRACESGKRELLPTIDAKLIYYLNVLAPGLTDWAIARARGV